MCIALSFDIVSPLAKYERCKIIQLITNQNRQIFLKLLKAEKTKKATMQRFMKIKFSGY